MQGASRSVCGDDLAFDHFVPAKWSAGNSFVFVPVRNRASVDRSRPDLGRWNAAFAGVIGAFVFCGETVAPENTFHARMFAPTVGIAEDPATGSAAAALAGMVAASGTLGEGEHELGLEQGYAMGRPSVLRL